jgi:hypothetical protein
MIRHACSATQHASFLCMWHIVSIKDRAAQQQAFPHRPPTASTMPCKTHFSDPSFSTTVLVQNDPPARTCWVPAYRVGDYSPCVSQVFATRLLLANHIHNSGLQHPRPTPMDAFSCQCIAPSGDWHQVLTDWCCHNSLHQNTQWPPRRHRAPSSHNTHNLSHTISQNTLTQYTLTQTHTGGTQRSATPKTHTHGRIFVPVHCALR